MIITRLNGGLGNQLFQYAFGRALAESHGMPLRLDTRDYQRGPPHGLLIQNFNIDGKLLSAGQATNLPDILHRRRWQRWLWNLNPRHIKWVREKPFGSRPQCLLNRRDFYLDGYWQSEAFFCDSAPTLRREFTLKAPPSSETQEMAAIMRETRSVAMHVRRGDYVTDPTVRSRYLTLPFSYYERCLNDWAVEARNIWVFVFSNDIPWCQEHFRFPYPTSYVSHTSASTAHEDLFLMQQAECCIMANSTLSWWGAWLGQRPHRRVYTPWHWFHPKTFDDRHLPCAGWVRIPVDPPCSQSHGPPRHAA